MGKAFNRLEQVLTEEKRQGHKNKAVVGGIRQYANFWVEQARGEAIDEADRALIEQIAESLIDYGNLPGVEARAKSVAGLLEKIQQRKERHGQQPEKPAPPKSKEPRRETPKPKKTEKIKASSLTAQPPPLPRVHSPRHIND